MTARLLLNGSMIAAALLLGQPAAAQSPAATITASQNSAHDRLFALFAASDEANLKRNPLGALFRGDMRYADRLGDGISEEYYAAERAAAEADLAALAQIDRSALTPADQISYDVFKWQTELALRGLQPDMLELTAVRPIDHFLGFHVFLPTVLSGKGAAPFKTVADYENNLKRLDDYIRYLDRAIGRMREGMASGVVNSKLVMNNVAGQLDNLIAEGVEGSIYYGPVKAFPDAISTADRSRLTAAYAAYIRDKLIPAHTRLRDFIRTEYLPKARDGVGLVHMKGGDKLYRYQIETLTTTRMDPEAVHQLGLSEVARIKAAQEKVKDQVGFKGTLREFSEHLRTAPQFRPTSKQALIDGYFAIEKRMKAVIGREFSLMPKTPLDIRPVEEFREKTAANGSYQRGAPDGSRPGVFYFNGYDLPSRSTWGMETLFLHEGAPGHHFQLSLAQENDGLPAFQRFGGNTAYAEGWGLYAESLGPSLGFFTDPYQMYGHLNDEIWRAVRLVVDTGIHAKGWSRDQAIQYMLDNTALGRANIEAEVDRYIAWPGQALSYKIGGLKIRELRTRAEKALAPKFDPREFHTQVLDTGALPLTVLEAKIDRWIASKKV
jgi:uncharacterized protein (DUF885 family)